VYTQNPNLTLNPARFAHSNPKLVLDLYKTHGYTLVINAVNALIYYFFSFVM